MRGRVLGVAAGALLAAGLVSVPGALGAVAAAPGFRIESIATPTNFLASEDNSCNGSHEPGELSCDSYLLTVTNSGGAPTDGTPITIEDTLPNGLTSEGIFSKVNAGQHETELSCSGGSLVKCVYGGVLKPDEVIEVKIFVGVAPSLAGSVTNAVEVSGGGVSAPAVASAQNKISTTPAAAGLNEFHLDLAGADGSVDTQAGDHPFGVTAIFNFGAETGGGLAAGEQNYQHLGSGAVGDLTNLPVREVKDVVVDLPPGFVGDPQDATQCAESALEPSRGGIITGRTNCPASSQVGLIQLDTGGHIVGSSFGAAKSFISPIYNMVPESGYPAEFGFNFAGNAIILYASAVPTPQGYVLRVGSFGIPEVVRISNIALTFWGVPSEKVHNALRFNEKEEPVESGLQPLAFLTNPVDCSAGPLTATAMSDSWGEQGRWLPDGSPDLSDPAWHVASTVVYPRMTGCNLLQFTPAIEALPSTTQADEPTGFSVNLSVPQASLLPPNLPTPELKNVTITLPAGLSLNPSAADGLQACTTEEIALESELPGSCPQASVVATDKIVTPLLANPLEGQIYLASPRCDPCTTADATDGNMFRLYLEAHGSGVVIKKEGTVYANPTTGQLTTVFANNPQLPFSRLETHFKGGLRAPLATPQSCGTFTTTSDFTPWSSPTTPDANPVSQFDVSWDGAGGACPAGAPPLAPAFSAGTSNPDAGQYSPFTLTFTRQDREQDLAGIQVHMPPGLLGTLTGVPLCGEPQASLGTCSAESRIGSMTVAAGAGSHPFYTQGALYLTGPYGGAPFGLSIVVPTKAGPFNLGNVVVRAKIDIDPSTSALTVTTDPFPQIIDGIPLRLRTANVTVDRPGFIFNPTNCAQRQITATIAGAQGSQANVAAPYAVSGCKGLTFHPTFAVSTAGHTSRLNGASLDARVIYPTGSQGSLANIASVKVELPKQLPARLTTLQKACTAAVFAANPAACPAASIVGVARASTPLLPVGLSGPAYFVSHGGEAFPELIVVLQGYGVRVDLAGSTFISKQGITSSTFKTVPDVPVGSFELYLPEGPDSALAANGNLCTSSLRMPTVFTGQNGAELRQNTKITVTGCAGAKAAKAKAARRKARAARRKKKAREARARKAHHGHTGHAGHGRGN